MRLLLGFHFIFHAIFFDSVCSAPPPLPPSPLWPPLTGVRSARLLSICSVCLLSTLNNVAAVHLPFLLQLPLPCPLSPFPPSSAGLPPAKRHIVKFNFATCLTTTANERNIRIRTRSRTPSRILILIRLLLVSALTLTLSRHVAAPRRNLSNEFRVISQNCTS